MKVVVVLFQLSLHMHYCWVVVKGAMMVIGKKYGELRFLIVFVSITLKNHV